MGFYTLFKSLTLQTVVYYGLWTRSAFPNPRRKGGHLKRCIFQQKIGISFQFFRNKYLNQAFPGAWFRTNFQDLLSYRGSQKLEWFEVLEGAECSPIPATVNAGRPPRDICLDADAEERRCICINTGRTTETKTKNGYEQICGTCRNPCLFKFTPDLVPPYIQKLAAQDEETVDYFYEDEDEK